MKTLVIVESPTKAKTIGKFLGKDYVVESSFGHVRDLPKSKMGVDIEGGTFEPTYRVPKDKAKRVKELKALAEKTDDVIFATDSDREGEAISWHLVQLLKINPKKAKRIVFHEITEHAIKEALEHSRHLNQDLVDAQQARRVLDRLVGYELSPLLWKKITRGLSAGRVQSVAVRLLVEREREIQAFVPDEYWTLEGEFTPKKSDVDFVAKLNSVDDKKLEKLGIKSKEEMDEILKNLDGASYTIEKIEKKEAKRNPLAPYITSTMQQQAHNKFGYSSKQIMRIAQQLYEGIDIAGEGHVGLITYMRTDSTNLSEKFLKEAQDFIVKEHGEKFGIKEPREFKKKTKGAQEAHEAIRPTDPTRTPESIKDYLDSTQFKLYSLIWKRALASQMAPAVLDRTSIDIKAKNYGFRANGQTMIFPGWLALYPETVNESMLPELEEKDTVTCKELKPAQHFTEPPARYSDASLVKALEEYGIGRPSTYAPTIGTIEARGYAERNDNKRLQPMTSAFLVNDLLVEHFPNIVDYSFTAKVEDDFDEIAHGKMEWHKMIKEFYEPFHKLLEEKEKSIVREDVLHVQEIGNHPKDGKPITARLGQYGPFVQWGSKDDEEKPKFAALEKGQTIESITLEDALHLLSLPRLVGQKDGVDITANRGRFGPYVQVGKKYYSLKEDSPYEVTEEKALVIIAEKDKADAEKEIQVFPEEEIEVLNGRYGPYVRDTKAKKNGKIPEDMDPKTLTVEQCRKILAEAKTRKRRPRKKKAAEPKEDKKAEAKSKE
jgi:DNA topoisomerase I